VTISEGGPPRDVLDDGARPAGSLRVSASGLRVRLGGRDILNGLDIAVNAGELVAVSGPSGVGKTTLLLVLAGALSPDSGVVEVLGGGRRSPAGGDDVGRGAVGGVGAGGGAALGRAGGAGGAAAAGGARGEPGQEALHEPQLLTPEFAASAFDPLGSPDIPVPASAGSIRKGSGGRRGHESSRRAGTGAAHTGSAVRPDRARWHKRRDGATGSDSLPIAGEDPDRRSAGGRGSLTVSPAGFVPQTFGLAPWLTAAENVALVMQVLRLAPDVVEQRTTEALDAVGLGAAFDRIVTELSGGQRQRVAVARALAAQPAVIIADEPTAELDAENRSLVLDLLLDATDAGAAVILATHDPEVTRRCTRLLVLSEGRLVEAP